jgi:hypothetical protein
MRPRLARLIDIAEEREVFQQQVSGKRSQLQAVVSGILGLPGAPKVQDREKASNDVLVIIRCLVDAAGERGEPESDALLQRIEGAVWGYLRSCSKQISGM